MPSGRFGQTLGSLTGRSLRPSVTREIAARLPADPWQWLGVLIVLATAAVLRLTLLTRHSLWLDEGATVYLTNKSWSVVLGFDGPYDPHPPLYYAAVKAVAVLAPDMVAGRLLSTITGVATVVVVFLIGRRLAAPSVGLVAALVVAISPIHVWYSAEARQYAPVVLIVAISYYGLIRFRQDPRLRWVIVYAGAAATAIYVDFSALYGLVPQILLIGEALLRLGRRGVPLAAGAVAAVMACLPLVPWASAASDALGANAGYSVTWMKLGHTLLALVGLGGNAAFTGAAGVGYYWGGAPMAWDVLGAGQPALLAAVLITFAAGSWYLWRVAPSSAAAMFAMVSAVAVAASLSTIRTGFIERATVATILGWSLCVAGAALAVARPWGWSRLMGTIRVAVACSVLGILVFSGLSLKAVLDGGIKQDWRGLAADVAAARAGHSETLVIAYPTLAETLLAVYEPDSVSSPFVGVADGATSDAWIAELEGRQRVVLAYMAYPGIERVQALLTTHGYEFVSQAYRPDPLFTETYELAQSP